jgi:spore coat protein CotH
MNGRTWLVAALALVGLLAAWSPADEAKPAAAKAGKKDQASAFFGLDRVHSVHLHLSAKEWQAMQPAAPRFPWMPGTPPKAQEKADTHKGGFGMEFPWARGEVTIDGKTLSNVGLRYKGNFTYMASSRGLKRPIKIDLGRHEEGQRFLGLRRLNLNNGVTDPSKAREALSCAVFRAAGVPAPRTAFAEVTLTVPGKYDREYVGLYTLVEQVDKTFLKDRFTNGKGMLLKPEGLQNGLQHFGGDWKQYEPRYRTKSGGSARQQRRLIELTHLVNAPDEERFRKEVGASLDVEAFLRFLAANALLANMDSFLGFGHNYYLYLRPDTDRFVFIPWDLDLSMAAWPMAGPPEQQVNLSLLHPHRGENKLIDRLLASKDVREKYLGVVKELTAGPFTRERLLKELEAVEKAVKDPLAREAKAVQARKEGAGGFGPGSGVFGASLPPRRFIERRTESVAAQLAGKSKGYVPPAGFAFGPGGPGGGFGGPPGPPPQQGAIMPRPLQDQLGLTEAQRKRFAELQKEVDRKVKEILTEEQRAMLKQLREGRPGGPPGPPQGPPPGRP